MITIIPAIDIMDGKCVRLASGDFSKKVEYRENPVEAARRFEDAGLKRLHLVDLDGARHGRVINFNILEEIAVRTKMVIDFGGGIKSAEDIKIALESGANLITTGSIAFKNQTLLKRWIDEFGVSIFIAAADVRDEKIVVAGWQQDTDISIYKGIDDILKTGISQILCTDVSKDGNMQGTATTLYKKITENSPSIHLIASGGVSSLSEIEDVDKAGCKEVIIGKALYEGKIKLADLKPWIQMGNKEMKA